MMAKSGERPRQRPTLQSFRDGTEVLARAIAAGLGDRLRLNACVTRVELDAAGTSFQLTIRTPGKEETILANNVIVATPPDVAGELLRDVNPSLGSLLGAIEYAPVAVVSLGYRRSDVGHPLHGFGFLVPRSAGLRVLGTVWNSSLFPGRAPDGQVLLTSFVGGATDPGAAALSPQELASLVDQRSRAVAEDSPRRDGRAGRAPPLQVSRVVFACDDLSARAAAIQSGTRGSARGDRGQPNEIPESVAGGQLSSWPVRWRLRGAVSKCGERNTLADEALRL